MNNLLRDIRYGARRLLKAPAFSGFIIITLALGIGVNTAIFSVAYVVLFRPLPYNDPNRIVMIWENNPRLKLGVDKLPASPADFLDWREQNKVFQDMAAFSTFSFSLTDGNVPEKIDGALCSAGFFPVMGTQAALGRTFAAGEDKPGSANVVVISDSLWKRRFGADPNIIDKTVTLTGQKYSIIGVMPPGFDFPQASAVPDLGFTAHTEAWAPLPFDDVTAKDRRTLSLPVIARLKPNVSLEQAQADMSNVAASIDQQYKKSAGFGATVIELREQIVGDLRLVLLVLLGTVAFVLLIACSNVANLLLAWFLQRQKEFAVRTSLGASRAHLIRQMLTESIMLAIVGGVVGLVLASWGTSALLALNADKIPHVGEIGINRWVLGFTFLVSCLTGVLIGMAPALQASNTDINAVLKEEARGSSGGVRVRRFRNLLIVSEIALTLVLLIGAGLLIKSYWLLHQVKLGFNPENVLTMQMALPEYKYPTDAQRADLLNRVLQRVSVLPGVKAAAISTSIPLTGTDTSSTFEVVGRPPASAENKPLINLSIATPDYFKVLETPLTRGRFFTDRDAGTAPPVALINEALAQSYFPNEDPVGKQLAAALEGGTVKREIVGVVGNVRSASLGAEPKASMYIPYAQVSPQLVFLTARTQSAPLNLAAAVRNEVQAVDRDQPVYEIQSMEQVVDRSAAQQTFSMLLLSIFAGLALILAVIGVYAIVASSVAQRTQEIGVRMALGATPGNILKLIIRQGIVYVLIGLAIGLVAAFAMTRAIESLLYQIKATDPLTFGVAVAALIGVALLALYIPARRAAKLEPMNALRKV
ncbi:MAG TPA: ABC transporter permease [Pyrinomonadaceae bacterium]|jgi:putative ABC transport system permease protein